MTSPQILSNALNATSELEGGQAADLCVTLDDYLLVETPGV